MIVTVLRNKIIQENCIFSALAKHEVTLELSTTSCLRSTLCLFLHDCVLMAQTEQMNPVPIGSKIHHVVVSSTGFTAVMVKV